MFGCKTLQDSHSIYFKSDVNRLFTVNTDTECHLFDYLLMPFNLQYM